MKPREIKNMATCSVFLVKEGAWLTELPDFLSFPLKLYLKFVSTLAYSINCVHIIIIFKVKNTHLFQFMLFMKKASIYYTVVLSCHRNVR